MELELKDLGQTLAIGGFTIFGLFYLIKLCIPRLARRSSLFSIQRHTIYHSGMILAVVFAAGVIVEDVSKNFTAERAVGEGSIFNISSTLFNNLVDTDKDLRFKSLFTVHESSSSFDFSTYENVFHYIEFTPAFIHNELINIDHKDQVFKNRVNEYNSIPKSDCSITKNKKNCKRVEGDEDTKKLRNAVNGFYYTAKNRVYQHDNYFNELQGIERRVNFARSLTFLCLIYAGLYLIILFVLGLRFVIQKWLSSTRVRRVISRTLQVWQQCYETPLTLYLNICESNSP